MLFNDIEILNTKLSNKKPIEINVRINHKCTTLYMKNGTKTTVEGFIHPESKLLISDKYEKQNILDDIDDKSAHRKYMDLALDYAKVKTAEFVSEIMSLSPEDYQNAGYKMPEQFKREITKALSDEFKIEKNILTQLAVVRSKDIPEPNQFLVYADEQVDQVVTEKLPYKKPIPARIPEIDKFLSVFFNDEDKEYFSWYMGATLLNKPISDYTLSKMLVIGSAVGGVGKSTLMSTLVKHVFTPTYASILGDYDSYFMNDSRFGTSYLPSTRLIVFNEASWGKGGKETHEHDFTGMNTNAIKSILTDGYLDEEQKFGDRKTIIKHSSQVALTNYMPKIKESDSALNRRILPVIIKPTSMVDKTYELGLFGSAFDEYVKENSEKFCAHFINAYLEDPNLTMGYVYNHENYIKEVHDDKEEKERKVIEQRKQLSEFDNVIELLTYMKEEETLDTTHIIEAIEEHLRDDKKHRDLVRIDNGTLWLNSSVKLLSTYSKTPHRIKELLAIKYGNTYKKYTTRRFLIPFKQ